jgi:hypothetical protein
VLYTGKPGSGTKHARLRRAMKSLDARQRRLGRRPVQPLHLLRTPHAPVQLQHARAPRRVQPAVQLARALHLLQARVDREQPRPGRPVVDESNPSK